MVRMSVEHKCSKCNRSYALEALPTAKADILESTKIHYPLSDIVYTICPYCGKKDWATDRRFFGFLGPKGLYRLLLLFVIGFLIAVIIAAVSN